MRLLLDQNLSHRLVPALQDCYPGSVHVRDVGLSKAPDEEIWRFATSEGLTIVSKDFDFHQRSLVRGHPPKVVWLRIGNLTTEELESFLRRRESEIRRFCEDSEAALLVLS